MRIRLGRLTLRAELTFNEKAPRAREGCYACGQLLPLPKEPLFRVLRLRDDSPTHVRREASVTWEKGKLLLYFEWRRRFMATHYPTFENIGDMMVAQQAKPTPIFSDEWQRLAAKDEAQIARSGMGRFEWWRTNWRRL
jgi:hypothetical protein